MAYRIETDAGPVELSVKPTKAYERSVKRAMAELRRDTRTYEQKVAEYERVMAAKRKGDGA